MIYEAVSDDQSFPGFTMLAGVMFIGISIGLFANPTRVPGPSSRVSRVRLQAIPMMAIGIIIFVVGLVQAVS